MRNVYPTTEQHFRNLNTMAGRQNFVPGQQFAYPLQIYPNGSQTGDRESNSGLGIFTSLWRKHRSKTSGRRNSSKRPMTSSATTIFKVDPGHPSYPRFSSRQAGTPALMGHQDGNGNPAALPPLPLSLGVHVVPGAGYYKNQDQRLTTAPGQAFQPGFQLRQLDLINGRSSYGTPTMVRSGGHCQQASSAHPAQLHGTLSNRQRRHQHLAGKDDDNSDEESSRLLLGPHDDVWTKPLVVSSSTLGRPSRVTGNQGVMPNPDDILPKQAWTDFSGTDDWPELMPTTGSDSSGSKRPRRARKKVETSNDVEENADVYVNVKRSTSPPVPKERKILKTSTSGEKNFDHLKDLIYESFVDDDDDDDEGVASDSATKSDQNLNDESLQHRVDDVDDDLVENVGPNLAAQTFRTTKFINVTNSPRVMSPINSSSSNGLADR